MILFQKHKITTTISSCWLLKMPWIVRNLSKKCTFRTQVLQTVCKFFFTLHSNKSRIPISSLFPPRRRLCEGCFFVYICNVQRSEYRKREGRVHTCRQPCAHGRRSFFRHSTIGCTDARQRMWHTGRKECDCKRGKCIIIQSDCINMQNWPHENRVYAHDFSFGRK